MSWERILGLLILGYYGVYFVLNRGRIREYLLAQVNLVRLNMELGFYKERLKAWGYKDIPDDKRKLFARYQAEYLESVHFGLEILKAKHSGLKSQVSTYLRSQLSLSDADRIVLEQAVEQIDSNAWYLNKIRFLHTELLDNQSSNGTNTKAQAILSTYSKMNTLARGMIKLENSIAKLELLAGGILERLDIERNLKVRPYHMRSP